MIREELANRMAEENEPMFNSPQAQQSQVNSWAKQVEELKALRDSLDNQIREIEELANLLNVNEGPTEDKAALDAKRLAIDKEITALNKRKQDLAKPGASATLEENSTNISISPNQIRSYITELIYSAEDMEYTPEMVKELKSLKAELPRGKMSVESALDIIQQTKRNENNSNQK